jgi:hypothetical protein
MFRKYKFRLNTPIFRKKYFRTKGWYSEKPHNGLPAVLQWLNKPVVLRAWETRLLIYAVLSNGGVLSSALRL